MTKKLVDVFSLPPGFIVIYYEPGSIDPEDLAADEATAKEFERRGYFGGLILPKGVEIKSLSDTDLEELGLKRIEPTKPKKGDLKHAHAK